MLVVRTDPVLGDIVICPRCQWENPANAMWENDAMCLVCAIDTGQMYVDLDEADNIDRLRRRRTGGV